MKFTEPAREALFLKRYKRFFADVDLNGKLVVSHVPNTGSLKTCLFPNSPCIVTESNNPERKLKATLQFLKTPTTWVGVNTALPNQLAYEAWEKKQVPDWAAFQAAQREYKISKETRLDLVLAPTPEDLKAQKNLYFVEVKNVTYAEDGLAQFPDAETTRGQKHLLELMKLKSEGHGAEILFVIQRSDGRKFKGAEHSEPRYAELLSEAYRAGVKIRALSCVINPLEGVELGSELQVIDL